MSGRTSSVQLIPDFRDTFAERCLKFACQHSSVISHIINEFGDVSLFSYLQEISNKSDNSYQTRDDLMEVIYRYVTPLLGPIIAKRVVNDLSASPVVLTANHHGVDYFAQSVQGSLIFSTCRLIDGVPASTVPVFACGNIPFNNLTYPRGLLLYHINRAGLEFMPKKLPIFPDRLKRCVVSTSPAFNQEMIQRALSRLAKMDCKNEISASLLKPIQKIFKEVYSDPFISALSNYSQQSVVINNRLWKRLFAESKSAPEMVYLELEKIATMLLKIDLFNEGSLTKLCLFDPKLRENLLEQLDGAKACWESEKLARRLDKNHASVKQNNHFNNCGTHFFWGMNNIGKRIPLYLETGNTGILMLCGIDDSGNNFEIIFSPESILEGLQSNKLIPSLFTCFLLLSFARGVNCLGGYYQSEYLPIMKTGVVNALQNTAGFHDVSCYVKQVPTAGYLSGMQAVMTQLDDGFLTPAGPVEIIAKRGLTAADIEKIMFLKVRNAHIASLFETLPDVTPLEIRADIDWKTQLANDCFKLLNEKIVIK